jgi:hypothetical protein
MCLLPLISFRADQAMTLLTRQTEQVLRMMFVAAQVLI